MIHDVNLLVIFCRNIETMNDCSRSATRMFTRGGASRHVVASRERRSRGRDGQDSLIQPSLDPSRNCFCIHQTVMGTVGCSRRPCRSLSAGANYARAWSTSTTTNIQRYLGNEIIDRDAVNTATDRRAEGFPNTRPSVMLMPAFMFLSPNKRRNGFSISEICGFS